MREMMLTSAPSGLLWLLVLLLASFIAVHAGRLALLGWRAVKGKTEPQAAEKAENAEKEGEKADGKPEKSAEKSDGKPEKSAEKSDGKPEKSAEKSDGKPEKPAEAPAPVYYLVEKKRVRQKPKYSEPKRIDFKG